MMRTTLRTLALGLAFAACAGSDGPSGATGTPAEIVVSGGNAEQVTVAMPVRTAVIVRAAGGAPVAGADVRFTVVAGDGFVFPVRLETDALGRANTNWYMGPRAGAARMRASLGSLTVEFTATATPFVIGQTYYGADQYIQFMPGSLPILITAPHGGSLMPGTLPNRSSPNATTARDTNTEELAHAMREQFQARLGAAPSIVITRLHRNKIDNNREIIEATELNPLAQRAWYEWHAFIAAARTHMLDTRGRGFYIDLHGHGHPVPRLELGYLITASQLTQTDAGLNALVGSSSIRTLASTGSRTHAELLRGATSMGTLFEARGFPAVPSSAQPDPAAEPYFNGGYNTGRYGSRDGGTIDGVQIETHFAGVRDNANSRLQFASALVDVMTQYFQLHYGMALGAAPAARTSFQLAGSLP